MEGKNGGQKEKMNRSSERSNGSKTRITRWDRRKKE